jgi:hypothetical protein
LIGRHSLELQRSLTFVALGAAEHVTSRHPAPRDPFTKRDRVKLVALLDGQHAGPALIERMQLHPRHQRLVTQRIVSERNCSER